MRGMRRAPIQSLPPVLLIGAFLLPVAVMATTLPEKPRRLGLCTACHAENGRAIAADAPHLDGQRAFYLAEQLRQYRDGRRKAPAMNTIAGSLGEADIEALSSWFAAQGDCARDEGGLASP